MALEGVHPFLGNYPQDTKVATYAGFLDLGSLCPWCPYLGYSAFCGSISSSPGCVQKTQLSSVSSQSFILTNIQIVQYTTHLPRIQVQADSMAVQYPTLVKELSPGVSSRG